MRRALWFWLFLFVAIGAGCANVSQYAGGGTPTPTASATGTGSPTPTPSPCNTTLSATVQIAMSEQIGVSVLPTYGPIYGYGDATSGNIPLVAGVVSAHVGDTVQFTNVDQGGVMHSATGFTTPLFPPTPFPFAGPQPSGTAITNASWSTGLLEVADNSGNPCYSSVFSLPATGTFLFGDYTDYNRIGMRDLLTVTPASGASSRRRRYGRPASTRL